jgi:hypothetical protein
MAQSLGAAGIAKIVIRERSDDTSFKRGTLLVDCGNEDLIPDGVSALLVPADETWYVVSPTENVIFVNSKGVSCMSPMHPLVMVSNGCRKC